MMTPRNDRENRVLASQSRYRADHLGQPAGGGRGVTGPVRHPLWARVSRLSRARVHGRRADADTRLPATSALTGHELRELYPRTPCLHAVDRPDRLPTPPILNRPLGPYRRDATAEPDRHALAALDHDFAVARRLY